MDLIADFIAAMAAVECAPARPSDIIADDTRRMYLLTGEKNPSASYQLKIEDDMGVGWWRNFRTGETHKWHGKSAKKLTAAERAAYRDKIEAARQLQEAQRTERAGAAARECKALWEGCQDAKSHPYAKKKGIEIRGARLGEKSMLLIPAYKEGKISTLQRIYPNGFKAFWEDGDVIGAYAPLAEAADNKETIIICEGWATGCSIRMALPDMPVVVAFNSGNLLPVGKVMRQKYPEARIIFAADDDRFGLRNAGREAADQAARVIGAHVIWPEFPIELDEQRLKDFNDLHLLSGLDAVKNRILAAVPANISAPDRGDILENPDDLQPSLDDVSLPLDSEGLPTWHEIVPISAYEDLYNVPGKAVEEDWESKMRLSKDGKGIVRDSIQNVILLLENHENYRGLICYDEFAHERVMTRKPPWEKPHKEFSARTLRDEDVTCLAGHMEVMNIKMALPTLRKALDVAIINERRNPAKEYFTRLEWDKIPRLNTWLREYCGCKSDDDEYLAAVGRKWLAAAVARVFEPGCKFDSILILEGPQNLGKSMLLRELATIHGRAYFDDTIKARDLANPSIVPKLQGVLIVELAEMSGFKRMGADEAKQVISTQVDRIIKKYANEPTMMPRQFVFAGTLNPMDGYLDDPTGNRRYWPVHCSHIDIQALKTDKEQLWAEAVALYRSGEKLYLDGKLYRKAEAEQKKRNAMHPWQPEIEMLVRLRQSIMTKDIWDQLGIQDRSKRTRQSSEDISKIMFNLGFEYTRKRTDAGDREYMWHRTAKTEPEGFEEEILG